MKLRSLCPMAVALGVWVGGSAQAADKAKTPVKVPVEAKESSKTPIKQVSAVKPLETTVDQNQKLAEAVAARLSASTISEGADVSIVTESGTVTISGSVREAQQKNAILQEIRVVPGVLLVRDGLVVGSMVRQAQAGGPIAGMPPVTVMPGASGPYVEPAPLGAPGAGMGDGAAPPLPPYAWPTYAPHNNASRIGYPTAYPYNAYPFIGPFYPFPKVPLGWRSVTMTWEDGHWWYGRTSAPHDYWRVRFW